MANITEITIENTVKESRQIMNNNFANLNEGLSTAGSVKTVNNILPDDNGNITVDLGSYAPLVSPALTGTPTAPTATVGTSTTQLATTAFVNSSITANAYTLPTATSSVLGGVKVGNNITNTSGAISITSGNITSALGFTPLSTAGGTMTGALVLSGAPTADLQAATKAYVDSAAGGSTVSITAGTILGGRTIPLPDGYTRAQCKYAVWPLDTSSLHMSVNQSTGVVTCYYSSGDQNVNDTCGYLCVAVK